MLATLILVPALRMSEPSYISPMNNCSSLQSSYQALDCCGTDREFPSFRQDIPFVNVLSIDYNLKYEPVVLKDLYWLRSGPQSRPQSQMVAFLEFGQRQEKPDPTNPSVNMTVQSASIVRLFSRYQDILGWEDLHSADATGYPPSYWAWTQQPDSGAAFDVSNNIPKAHIHLLVDLWKTYPLNCCGAKTLLQYYAIDYGVTEEQLLQIMPLRMAADVPKDATLLDLLEWVRQNKIVPRNGLP